MWLQVHGEKAERTCRLLFAMLQKEHGVNMPILRPHCRAARPTGIGSTTVHVPLFLSKELADSPVWAAGPFTVLRRLNATNLELEGHTNLVRFDPLPGKHPCCVHIFVSY